MTRRSLASIILAVGLFASCKNRDAARDASDCATIAEHMTVATDFRPEPDDDAFGQIEDGSIFIEMGYREWFASLCERGKWPKSYRDCLRKAKSEADFDRCDERMPVELAKQLRNDDEAGFYLDPPGPPPPGKHTRDCAGAGKRIAALAEWQLAGVREPLRQEARKRLADLPEIATASCRDGMWDDEYWCMLDPTKNAKRDACPFYQALRPSDPNR